jgi:hypothetical protein
MCISVRTWRVEEPVLFMRCASSMITVSQAMLCRGWEVRVRVCGWGVLCYQGMIMFSQAMLYRG